MSQVPGMYIPPIHLLVPLPFIEVIDPQQHIGRLSEESLPAGTTIYPLNGGRMSTILYDVGEGEGNWAELLTGLVSNHDGRTCRLVLVDSRPNRLDDFTHSLEIAKLEGFQAMRHTASFDSDGVEAVQHYILPPEKLMEFNISLSPRAAAIHRMLHLAWVAEFNQMARRAERQSN